MCWLWAGATGCFVVGAIVAWAASFCSGASSKRPTNAWGGKELAAAGGDDVNVARALLYAGYVASDTRT